MIDDVLPVVLERPTAPVRLGSGAYPPCLESVSRARRFVQTQVDAAGLPDRADDVGLLVSELASNAVLHARSDFDVQVHAVDAGVRVEVLDRSSVPPVFTAPSATATSGRGLTLVQTVATRWGCERLPAGGKSVWFEVAALGGGPDDEVSVEDLLALWAEPSEEELRSVVVPDLPVAGLLVAEEHMDDLLRELQLVLLASPRALADAGVPVAPGVAVAQRLDAAARAFEGGRRQVREQVTRASARGEPAVTLHLRLPVSALAGAVRYRAAVADAEAPSRTCCLLAGAEELGRHAGLRRRYLDEVIPQLSA